MRALDMSRIHLGWSHNAFDDHCVTILCKVLQKARFPSDEMPFLTNESVTRARQK